MGLSVGSASRLAPTPGWVPHSCPPISPVQGFVLFFPLFPVCDKHDSCQPGWAPSPRPRPAVYLGDEPLWPWPLGWRWAQVAWVQQEAALWAEAEVMWAPPGGSRMSGLWEVPLCTRHPGGLRGVSVARRFGINPLHPDS